MLCAIMRTNSKTCCPPKSSAQHVVHAEGLEACLTGTTWSSLQVPAVSPAGPGTPAPARLPAGPPRLRVKAPPLLDGLPCLAPVEHGGPAAPAPAFTTRRGVPLAPGCSCPPGLQSWRSMASKSAHPFSTLSCSARPAGAQERLHLGPQVPILCAVAQCPLGSRSCPKAEWGRPQARPPPVVSSAAPPASP